MPVNQQARQEMKALFDELGEAQRKSRQPLQPAVVVNSPGVVVITTQHLHLDAELLGKLLARPGGE